MTATPFIPSTSGKFQKVIAVIQLPSGLDVGTATPLPTEITSIDYVSGKSGIDSSTETLQTIEYEHHEIHSGSSYTTDRDIELANGASGDILLITPDTTKYAHFFYELEVEAEAQFTIWEAPTATAGTAMNAINRNRNLTATKPATMTLSHTPTGITTGSTIIRQHHLGAGKTLGGGARGSHEFVLKRNTKYLIRTTNLTVSDNWVSIILNWYEHTDKN